MSATTGRMLTNYQSDHHTNESRTTAAARSLMRTLRVWRARHRERHMFELVEERDLRDVGLSRWEFDRELAKPFWRG